MRTQTLIMIRDYEMPYGAPLVKLIREKDVGILFDCLIEDTGWDDEDGMTLIDEDGILGMYDIYEG